MPVTVTVEDFNEGQQSPRRKENLQNDAIRELQSAIENLEQADSNKPGQQVLEAVLYINAGGLFTVNLLYDGNAPTAIDTA